ncbi:MAG: hypothetical protein ABWY19_02900 [Marmoricola sp.]
MRAITKRTAIAAALAIGATAGFAVSANGATVDHDVRQSDFTTTDAGTYGFAASQTRATGHYDFLKEGLRLWTESNTSTDKVAEYFPVDKPLSGVTQVDYDWYGTTPSPGAQYVMDFDDDGSQDGILVGEKVYGGEDVWLTGSSKADYKGTGAPSNTGGSGSENHGTLTEWSAKYPDARILFGGFSLGSGVKGDGVLRSLSLGDDRYVFTDLTAPEPDPEPTVVDPQGSVQKGSSHRTGYVWMRTAAIPEGSVAGDLPTFAVTINGTTKTVTTPAPGEATFFSDDCPKNTACTFKVYKDGREVTSARFTISKTQK